MCRFAAYLGQRSVLLADIIEKPDNSLIRQSKEANNGRSTLNADGFGIGWYNKSIRSEPGIFKSTQPAWNDINLLHLTQMIKSSCFIGHVRASTVGDVNILNCHPFGYKNYLFVHNGTISGFDHTKRKIIEILKDDYYGIIKAQTDSEHIFALLMQLLDEDEHHSLANATHKTISTLLELQKKHAPDDFSRLNFGITNGDEIVATRFSSGINDTALSLYYSIGDKIDLIDENRIMQHSDKTWGAILIASEPLTHFAKEWHELPENHLLHFDGEHSLVLKALPGKT